MRSSARGPRPDAAARRRVAEAPDELLDRLDGLMLAGGSDIDPAAYGARAASRGERAPRPSATASSWPWRTARSSATCRCSASAAGCSCSTSPAAARSSSTCRAARPAPPHARRVRRPRRAARARLAGGARGRGGAASVRSHHHQGVDELGEGLVASGWSEPDGLVEAVEVPGPAFALGVLWHPEEDESAGVVGALVEAARAEVAARDDRGGRARHRAGDGRGAGGGSRRPTPPWRARRRPSRPGARVSPGDRSRLLHGLADALEEPAGELATLEARNAGKPIGDARGEMGMVVETFRYYAGAPERLLGDTIPVAGGVDMTFREPLGVVGLIVPWNFPLVIASWKVAPALAAGNTRGAQAGRAHAADRPRVRADRARGGAAGGRGERGGRARAASAASGWSSTPTWRRWRSPARPRWGAGSPRRRPQTIKRVTLELGGKSANVVFADADLERPRRQRRSRSSATPARTAAPARASSWSARRSTASWRRSRTRSRRCAWATRSTSRPRWGR